MSTLEQFIGGPLRTPSSIVNLCSDGSTLITGVIDSNSMKSTLSGALTANTYKSIVSVTGAGILKMCTVSAVDATARTMGLKVVLDGTTVFDAVSSSCSASGSGLIAAGQKVDTAFFTDEFIPFTVSMALWIKSSLTETDKVQLNYKYHIVT